MPVNSIVKKGGKKKPRYAVVANELRKHIQTLNTGDMLPTEQELADKYSISYMTLRRVVDVMAREGRVKRYQGKGTIITNRLSTGEIAIVVRPLLLTHSMSSYYKQTSNLLITEMQKQNPKWQIKLHVGKHVEEELDFPPTLNLLEPEVCSILRGVFSLNALFGYESGLEEFGIPFVSLALTDKTSEHRVGFDYDALLGQAMKHLVDAGCKKIGLIGHNPRYLYKDDGKTVEITRNSIKGYGSDCQKEWISLIGHNLCEQQGYELFMNMWHQADRPDGIFISDDVVCCGVLRAILQLGIKIPKDLKIISQANKTTVFPFHLPVTRVEFDLVTQVRRAVDMMFKLVRSEAVDEKIVLLTSTLIKGETT